MEVKVGITDSPRELVFSSAQTPAEVEEAVSAALRGRSEDLSLRSVQRRFLRTAGLTHSAARHATAPRDTASGASDAG